MKVQLIPFHRLYSKEYDTNCVSEYDYDENEYPVEVSKYGIPTETDDFGLDHDKPYFRPFCLSVFQIENDNDKIFLGNIKGYVTDGSLIYNAYHSGYIEDAFLYFDAASEILSQFFLTIHDKYKRGDIGTVLITQYPEKAYGLESFVLRLVPYCMNCETNEMYITNGYRELLDDDFLDDDNEVMSKRHTNYLKSKMKFVNDMFYKISYGRLEEVEW